MAGLKCIAAIFLYSFLYSLLSEFVVEAGVYEAVADFNDASPSSDSDIDECAGNPCDANALCINTVGSFLCICNEGFSGSGFVCQGKKKAMCGMKMKPLGCFQDSIQDRALGYFLASYRQGLRNQGVFLDWYNYQQSLNSMKCNCAKQAKEAGYKYFGIQYYGECWAGNNAYNKHGESPDCINGKFKKCISSKDSACTGRGDTSYIYELLA